RDEALRRVADRPAGLPEVVAVYWCDIDGLRSSACLDSGGYLPVDRADIVLADAASCGCNDLPGRGCRLAPAARDGECRGCEGKHRNLRDQDE
ncbi:MAG TPA: hypothetical protein VGH35_09895, partial [Gaiellaceae bacterium]